MERQAEMVGVLRHLVRPVPLSACLLFLTGGIGITPAVAMLRALTGRTGRHPDTVLVHSAPDAGRVCDLRTGDVHGEPGDLIQTCVSAACGPVHLDL